MEDKRYDPYTGYEIKDEDSTQKYNAQNDEKDTSGNEYLKRKNVCNGLSVCHFMKRLCCYELLRNLYNIA